MTRATDRAPVRRWSVPAAYGDYPGVVVADGAVWGVPRGEEVLALSLTDGAPRWRSPLAKRAAVFTPALTADLVLFGTSSFKAGAHFNAAERTTGVVRWTAPIDVLGLAHPLVIGDTVVVRNREPDQLVCLEIATGRERWRRNLPTARFTADYAQTLHLDGLLVTCDAEGIKWFDAATGEPRRRIDLGFLTSLLEDTDSIVAIARTQELHVVPRAGDEAPRKISFPKGYGPFNRVPACRGGLVHGASEDFQTRFSVYLAKGEVTIHESNVHGFGNFVAGVDEVYAIHEDQLRAFDASTGAPRWQVSTDPPVSEPAFAMPIPHADGLVVVAANAVHAYVWE